MQVANIVGHRSYEVPSYVTEHASGHTSFARARVGAIEGREVLDLLAVSPLGGSRAYEVPSYATRVRGIGGIGFPHTGAEALSDPVAKPTDKPTDATMTPAEAAGASLALIGGVLVVLFVVEVGVGYFVYKMSKSVPLGALIGFFTAGPVGLLGAAVGGFAASKRV